MIDLEKFLKSSDNIAVDELGYDIKYPICLFKLFTPEEDIIFVFKERYLEDLESTLINFDENKFSELFFGLYYIAKDTFYFPDSLDIHECLNVIDISGIYISSLSGIALRIVNEINGKLEEMISGGKVNLFDESNIHLDDFLNYIRNGEPEIENILNSYIGK